MKSSFRNLREIDYPKCFGTILHYGGAIYLVNKDDSFITLHVSVPLPEPSKNVQYKGQLISKCFLVSSFGPRTMDAQRGTNIQCTSKNSLPFGH